MNGKVGIAADGTGKVGIVLQHQAEMALGFGRIFCFLHAAQDAGVHRDLDGFAAGLVQQGSQFQLGGSLALEADIQPAGFEHGHELFQALGIGSLMDTIEERYLVSAAGIGCTLVGQQHEFLDHALGDTAVPLDHVNTAALLVQDQLGLGGFDVQAAAGLAQSQTLFVQFLHDRQLSRDGGIFLADGLVCGVVQQGVDLLVHALDAAADDGLDKAVLADIAVCIQLHQAGECQTGLVLVQTADAVGQLLGQHGDDLVRIINAGGTLKRFLVQFRVRLDIMADVRDVDTQLIPAVIELHQADGIVNVLGFGGVDGENGDTAQVHAMLDLRLGDAGAANNLGFLQHFLRELLAHLTAVENGLGALPRHLGGAEALHDGHPVVCMAAAAQREQCTGLVPGTDTHVLPLADDEVDAVASIRLQSQASVVGTDNGACNGIVRLSHLDDLALGAALHPGMVKQADLDLVFGHGAVQGAARNEDVPFPVVPGSKTKPGSKLDQRAGNGGGLIFIFYRSKARRILAVFHRQLTRGHHSGNGIAQTVAVHLEFRLKLPQVVRLASDSLQDVLLQSCHMILLLHDVTLPSGRVLPRGGHGHIQNRHTPQIHLSHEKTCVHTETARCISGPSQNESTGSTKARTEHADNERRDKEDRAADLGGLGQLGVNAALTAGSHKAVVAHDGGGQALALAFLCKSKDDDEKRNGNQNNAENDLVNAH